MQGYVGLRCAHNTTDVDYMPQLAFDAITYEISLTYACRNGKDYRIKSKIVALVRSGYHS